MLREVHPHLHSPCTGEHTRSTQHPETPRGPRSRPSLTPSDLEFCGAPGRIRTCGRRIRSGSLVPPRVTSCRSVPRHPNQDAVLCHVVPPADVPVQNCGAQTEHTALGSIRWRLVRSLTRGPCADCSAITHWSQDFTYAITRGGAGLRGLEGGSALLFWLQRCPSLGSGGEPQRCSSCGQSGDQRIEGMLVAQVRPLV